LAGPQGSVARLAHQSTEFNMARKKPAVDTGFVLFDVTYEDGRLTSNRKVPAEGLGGLDGDAPAKTFIEQQDRKIAEMSGQSRGKIKSIKRSPGQ
jgi:hypothetical protein